jgi:hypothetical protein
MSKLFVMAALIVATCIPARAIAQERNASLDQVTTDATPSRSLRAAIERIQFDTFDERDFLTSGYTVQPTPPARQASVGQKILFSAIGATAGFFGGGVLGASIEPPCHCDDPGLKGALIGAPIGAVVGGIVGWKVGGWIGG